MDSCLFNLNISAYEASLIYFSFEINDKTKMAKVPKLTNRVFSIIKNGGGAKVNQLGFLRIIKK